MSNKATYLNWISDSDDLLITDESFDCKISKVNGLVNGAYVPVLEVSDVRVLSYDNRSHSYREFMDFLQFLERNNPRIFLYLKCVSMHLYRLVDDGYTIVDAHVDGASSHITIYKATSRI